MRARTARAGWFRLRERIGMNEHNQGENFDQDRGADQHGSEEAHHLVIFRS
jgi:hypothetical protein